MSKQLADTIIHQLGGNHFLAATGSHDFVYGENYLRMRLVRNKSNANILKITLTPEDLYNVEFIRMTERKPKIDFAKKIYVEGKTTFTTKYKAEGVFFDQLQEIFERVTGLYIHPLGR